MLILVGVTINVALNGGLFDEAKTASDGTQKEADREALISAVVGTLNDDGTVNLTNLQSHLPEGFSYSNGIYTNTNNGKQYTVDSETGKVQEYTETDETNEWYNLGLTSPNVQYGVTYTRVTGDDGASSIILYENGTLAFNGGNAMTVSELENAYSGSVTIGENYFLLVIPNYVTQLTVFDNISGAMFYEKTDYIGPFDLNTFIESTPSNRISTYTVSQ